MNDMAVTNKKIMQDMQQRMQRLRGFEKKVVM
jgi:hypothetical protein